MDKAGKQVISSSSSPPAMAASSHFLSLPFPVAATRAASAFSPSHCTLSRRPLCSRPLAISASISSSGLSSEHWAAVETAESAANPALRNSNVLFFKSGYNVQIVVGEEESEEALLRRFRREVSKAGVIQECKRRKFFENKHEEKKRKAREAGRRNSRRRRFGLRFPSKTSEGDAAPKKVADDDNWEMPAGDIPL